MESGRRTAEHVLLLSNARGRVIEEQKTYGKKERVHVKQLWEISHGY